MTEAITNFIVDFDKLKFTRNENDLVITGKEEGPIAGEGESTVSEVKYEGFFTAETPIDVINANDVEYSIKKDATIDVGVNGEYTPTAYNENITISNDVTLVLNNHETVDTSIHTVTLVEGAKINLKYLKGDTEYSFGLSDGKASYNSTTGALTLSTCKHANFATMIIKGYGTLGEGNVTFTNDSETTPYNKAKLEDCMLTLKSQSVYDEDDVVPFTLDGTKTSSSGVSIPFNGTFMSDSVVLGKNNDNNNEIYGYGGEDYIITRKGNDTIYGGDGNDYIDAGSGDDAIYGGAGDDTINGGEGDDKIQGGDGNDTIDGGTGKDTFIYEANGTSFGKDVIKNATADDNISFSVVKVDVSNGESGMSFAVNSTVQFSDLVFAKSGNDLMISKKDNNADDIKIEDFFTATSKIDKIVAVENGTYSVPNQATKEYSIKDDATINVTVDGEYTPTDYNEKKMAL